MSESGFLASTSMSSTLLHFFFFFFLFSFPAWAEPRAERSGPSFNRHRGCTPGRCSLQSRLLLAKSTSTASPV